MDWGCCKSTRGYQCALPRETCRVIPNRGKDQEGLYRRARNECWLHVPAEKPGTTCWIFLLEIECHYVAQAGPWIHHSCLRLPGAGDWSQECTMTPGSVIFFWGKEVSHVVQASLTSTLELEMILPPHPEYWGDKCASPHLVYTALWLNGGSLYLRLFKLALLPACNIFIHVSLTVSSDNNDQCIQKKHKKF